MYSRNMIEDNQLRFLDGIYHQDVDFNLRMYAFANRIMFLDTIVYCYCYNEEAISRVTSSKKAIKLITDDFRVVRHIRDFSLQNKSGAQLRSFYEQHGNSLLVSKLLILFKDSLLTYEEKVSVLETMKRLDLYPIKGDTLSWKTKVLKTILNIEFLLKSLLKYYHLNVSRTQRK